MCENCFAERLGVAPRTVRYWKEKVRNGEKNPVHGNEGNQGKSLTENGAKARAMMKEFFSLGGSDPTGESLHLPSMEKQDIWKELDRDAGGNMISLSWFYSLWRKEFPNVTIPKDSRLGKCDECVYAERCAFKRERSSCSNKAER